VFLLRKNMRSKIGFALFLLRKNTATCLNFDSLFTTFSAVSYMKSWDSLEPENLKNNQRKYCKSFTLFTVKSVI
jgi:hypothetical protein